jgi:hypothetical protein
MPLASLSNLQWNGPGSAACLDAASVGTVAAGIKGHSTGAGTITALGQSVNADATRLKNSPATLSGSGVITDAAPKGRARPTATVSIGSRPSADDVAQAVWGTRYAPLNDPESYGLLLKLAAMILRNKTITNPATGVMTVYDDDGTTPLLAADLWEDAAGTVAYDGTGAQRRDRLE